ncbi:F-box protein At2g27310-like [Rutidosis leptorrhynchoides]|uniref:F-box protein At2g27310-like n=1 Tax=Rutidosis leptorrhynchoides TaxID=125765 RepID=UPI003A98D022
MAIADIHEDIIRTHILTKLDGKTLAAAGCASSDLQSLCSDQKLWSEICSHNWPSTNHPLITKTISSFTSGHRSFYSDTFSSPAYHLTTTSATSSPQSTQLISAVDLKYNDELVLSKIVSTTTAPTDWFQTSPFRVDVLEPKEFVSSSIEVIGDEQSLLTNFEKNMKLSWVLIDPTRSRAMNMSSVKPVSVQRNWLTNDIELTFGVVIVCGNEHVSCNIQVTCGVKQGGVELNVNGLSLTVLDTDGKCLSGMGSMVILQELLVAKRQCNSGEEMERERYDEYIRRRKERNEKTERRERRLDMAFLASGVAMFMAFWSFAFC